MGDLTISVTVTDEETRDTETFVETVPADIAEDVKSAAWAQVTTFEQQDDIREPGFKQKAWAIARTFSHAWRHTHGQFVRKDPRYKPPETPPVTGEPPAIGAGQ